MPCMQLTRFYWAALMMLLLFLMPVGGCMKMFGYKYMHIAQNPLKCIRHMSLRRWVVLNHAARHSEQSCSPASQKSSLPLEVPPATWLISQYVELTFIIPQMYQSACLPLLCSKWTELPNWRKWTHCAVLPTESAFRNTHLFLSALPTSSPPIQNALCVPAVVVFSFWYTD